MHVDKVNKILRDLGLSNLSQEEQEMVVELVTEVADVFCNDQDDIGNVTDCKMKTNLKDKTPVQKSYYSMPKPLHQEVKNYVEDLLNKGWVTKSCSSYSSPVVAIRKKDGTLRLCCDYGALNKKTVVDQHPLPRVQDALDSLNGKKWFSLLDQQTLLEHLEGYMNGSESLLDCVMHLQNFNGTWRTVYWTSVMNLHSHTSAMFQFILTILKHI